MKKFYEEMIALGDLLEENGIDFVKTKKPANTEEIEAWETRNSVRLPEQYKELILLANGIEYGGTSIYSLNQIKKAEIQFEGYFIIGGYIGDGSRLLCDDNGTVFTGDHDSDCVAEVELKAFLQEWMLDTMKDDLQSNGIAF